MRRFASRRLFIGAERRTEMTHDQLARIALRYDTAMSRAMLRALGMDVPHRAPVGAIVTVDRYAGMMECFENHRGVEL